MQEEIEELEAKYGKVNDCISLVSIRVEQPEVSEIVEVQKEELLDEPSESEQE